MCARTLKPSAVSDEPRIHTGRDSRNKKGAEDIPIDKDPRCDIGVHGFWKTGQSTIFDVRITDTDCASWRDRDPHKVLAQHKKEKKRTYSVACTDRWRHFTGFSCDGMIAVEASAAINRAASLLFKKWHRLYPETCAYVRSRISISHVRAASHCLRGSRDPTARVSHATWETGSAMGLYR
jgi:IS1 family transposase